jgi:hypothetical protein
MQLCKIAKAAEHATRLFGDPRVSGAAVYLVDWRGFRSSPVTTRASSLATGRYGKLTLPALCWCMARNGVAKPIGDVCLASDCTAI